MNYQLFIILLTAYLPAQLYAQEILLYESGGPLIQEQAAFDVHHYDLNLKINPSDSTLSGSVTVQADIVHPTDVIVLDLDPRFTIDSIRELNRRGGDQDLDYHIADGSKRIYIFFPETRQAGEKFGVEVVYNGRPRPAGNPPWDGGFTWETTPSGDPWIGVTCQTIGAWVWWPNKDHPSDKPDSVSLNFTMPEELTVTSNGRLLGTTDAGDGWKTWHWFSSMPISNYNITVNAAPYRKITGRYTSITGDEMDIIFWVLPEYHEEGTSLFSQFPDQIQFMENLLGPYPFRADKYGVVHAPYLGMEHQTLIAYGAPFRNDNLFGADAGFDDLHQHELSHEWWGNLVSVWDWRDFWIHEGFGTYMQALYAEHLGGDESYARMMRVFRQNIVSNTELAPRGSQTTASVYGSGRGGDIYYKGAWFLHSLRYLIGDDDFFQSLRRFAYPDAEDESVTDGAHVRFVTTDDYLNLVNHLTGRDLTWFFEQYLRKAELPVLKKERIGDKLKLEWNPSDDQYFPMPVIVDIDGEKHVLTPDPSVSIRLPAGAAVKIDPESNILMNLEVKQRQD